MSLIAKPNKIWVAKGSEFCSGSMKSWLQDNDIEMYSTQNERKSVAADLLIYEYMTSVTNLCILIM